MGRRFKSSLRAPFLIFLPARRSRGKILCRWPRPAPLKTAQSQDARRYARQWIKQGSGRPIPPHTLERPGEPRLQEPAQLRSGLKLRNRVQFSIINLSSIWGSVAAPGAASYHATKAGVAHLTKNAAVTYAKNNIRVNSIHPGIIHTPMMDEMQKDTVAWVISQTPAGRTGQPEDIAAGAVYLAGGTEEQALRRAEIASYPCF